MPRCLARRISSNRLGRRDVADVDVRVLVLGQGRVARDGDALGHRGDPLEPEAAGDGALVRHPPPREVAILLVQHQRQAGHLLVLEGAAHHAGVGHRIAVVAEAGGPGFGQLGLLGQLVAGLPHRDRGVEAHTDHRVQVALVEQRRQHRGGVDHRNRVGHGHDGHETARCGGEGAGGDRLQVLTPGGAQVNMGVDETGQRQQAGAVDLLQARRGAADHAVAHHQVAHLVDARRRVQHPGPADHQGGLRPRSLGEPHRHQAATAPIGYSAGSPPPEGPASRS